MLCVLAPSCKNNYNLGTQEQREEEQKQSNSIFRPQYSTRHPISEKKSTNKVKKTNKQEHVKADRRISVELTYETDILIYEIRRVNI